MTIIQHCEKCGKELAEYTFIQDIEAYYNDFKRKHNYEAHPNIIQRMFWLILDGFYQ